MATPMNLGGSFTLPGTSTSLNRMGYGAMQLAGPQVFGPPRDRDAAIAVLREAVAAGVNHVDTSDYYGPHMTNQIIKEALHPYADGLVLVTKVGARRLPDKSWPHALSRQARRRGTNRDPEGFAHKVAHQEFSRSLHISARRGGGSGSL